MGSGAERKWQRLSLIYSNYLDGDPASTRELFEGLTESLIGFFFVRTRSESESEDLAQATLLKVHFARDRFNDELSLKTWVFTIAGRVLIDHWRARREEEVPLHEGESDAGPGAGEAEAGALGLAAADLSFRSEFGRDLNKALNILKPDDRMIVYLYAVEGFSMAEIAGSMGLTEAAVKGRAHRSYEKMRQVLAVLCLFLLKGLAAGGSF